MDPWIAILLVAGTTGLVVYLVSRKSGPKVTTVTRSTHIEDAEK